MADAFCTHCGTALSTDDRFCRGCGKPVIQPPLRVNNQAPPPAKPLNTLLEPTPPQRTRGSANRVLPEALNSFLWIAGGALVTFIGISLYMAFQHKQGAVSLFQQSTVLSGTYATQDMIRLNMTNSMGLTFYPNGTFQMRTGGMFKDDTGTYRLSGNSLIFSPSDPVYSQGNDPVTNGFTQALTGTVSDDRRTINYAGGVWVKTN